MTGLAFAERPADIAARKRAFEKQREFSGGEGVLVNPRRINGFRGITWRIRHRIRQRFRRTVVAILRP
jgi:hypothetical protein